MSPVYIKDVFIQKKVTYGHRDVNLLVQTKFKIQKWFGPDCHCGYCQ